MFLTDFTVDKKKKLSSYTLTGDQANRCIVAQSFHKQIRLGPLSTFNLKNTIQREPIRISDVVSKMEVDVRQEKSAFSVEVTLGMLK